MKKLTSLLILGLCLVVSGLADVVDNPPAEDKKPPTISIPKPPKISIPKPPKISIPKPPKISIPKPPKIRIPKPPKIFTPKPPTIRTPKLPTIRTPKPPSRPKPLLRVDEPARNEREGTDYNSARSNTSRGAAPSKEKPLGVEDGRIINEKLVRMNHLMQKTPWWHVGQTNVGRFGGNAAQEKKKEDAVKEIRKNIGDISGLIKNPFGVEDGRIINDKLVKMNHLMQLTPWWHVGQRGGSAAQEKKKEDAVKEIRKIIGDISGLINKHLYSFETPRRLHQNKSRGSGEAREGRR